MENILAFLNLIFRIIYNIYMSQGFINLEKLIQGERYSFSTQDIPGGRSQGTFDRAIVKPGMVNQYFLQMF